MSYNYTYKLLIDFGHLGDYSHTLANVTSRQKDGSLMIGFNDPFGEVAPPSRFEFSLLNDDKLLTPDNTASPYYGLLTRGTLVKITASYEGETYIEWVGKISKIRPFIHTSANPSANHYVAITAEDPMLKLLQAQIFPALQTDVLIHDAIAAIIDDASSTIVYPYTSSWAVVGVSVVGTAKVLDQDIYTHSDSLSQLSYVGDNSEDAKNTVGAQSLIRDLLAAELGGRFFWNGTKFEFQHRYFAIESAQETPALTLVATDIESGDYRLGDDLINKVTVTYQPRSIGTPATVIYSAERPTFLGAGQTKSTIYHFRDPDTPNARIGAFDVMALENGVDVIANSAQDGSGGSLTAFISASHQAHAQSATITLTNFSTTDAWITTLQIRGTPLLTYERETVTAVDAQSIYDDGEYYPRSYSYKLVDDEETAQGYANIIISRFSQQFSRFNSITFVANDSIKLLTAGVTIGQTEMISEQTSTKHNREYSVVGIQHNWNATTLVHRTTHYLSPIAREQYWTLGVAGYSELDTTAIIAL